MEITLDESLPVRLVDALSRLGHDTDTVPAEHLAGTDDNVMWQAAQTAQRFLITQDLDLSDARKYIPRSHSGLLLVRLPQAAVGDRLGRQVQFRPDLMAPHDRHSALADSVRSGRTSVLVG